MSMVVNFLVFKPENYLQCVPKLVLLQATGQMYS